MLRTEKVTTPTKQDIPPYQSCPAKTFVNTRGEVLVGRSVLNHCLIVGHVAKELIQRFPSEISRILYPLGFEIIAATHDIGKVSPSFFEKIRRSCTPELCTLPPLFKTNPDHEHQWSGHSGVSQLAAIAMKAPKYVPEILGQHHGFSPQVNGLRADDENFGGPLWQKEREALVFDIQASLGANWPLIPSIHQARLMAGLTSVADWIGSGEFFEDPASPWRENIPRALDAAGFILPTYRSGLSFQQVFSFTPRSAQEQFINAVTAPGVYVLEAPMGLGKTEAALYAAYRLLENGQASGIYFALPTQLTSNKILERFNAFLRNILAEECQHRSLLLHGKAWLQDTEMGEEARPGGSWFNHAKRGLLAPFAVGTIDQALMAAMNVKHGFVRAFGLTGKVVILDEVHTYDAYTGTLLDALVELLRDLHCTVIILSATLNRDRRKQILGCELSNDSYPLITALPYQHAPVELFVPINDTQTVAVRLLEQDEPAIQEGIDRAAQGQQVLWIENTVVEAQQRFLDLAARSRELGLACGLLHSRFTADDRKRVEDHWVNLFGKPGWSERPRQGRILIGTQVLEQSLDIDSDFLISRFAPSDMVLQRMGRLWRHADTPRVPSAVCEAWLLAPKLGLAIASPERAFGKTALVYSPYVLCRSLEVWQGRATLSLPQDIRPLIEQTYAQRHEDGSMGRWLDELDNGAPKRTGRKAMRQLARLALAESGNTLPESKAQTRYSEMESCEVLLLQGITRVPEQKASRLTLLSQEQIMLPWGRHKLNKGDWRALSAKLMRQIVSVPVRDAPLQLHIDILNTYGLQHCFYLGDPKRDEALLRVALVDQLGHLQGVQGARIHERNSLEYRNDLGYRVIKDGGQKE